MLRHAAGDQARRLKLNGDTSQISMGGAFRACFCFWRARGRVRAATVRSARVRCARALAESSLAAEVAERWSVLSLALPLGTDGPLPGSVHDCRVSRSVLKFVASPI